MDFSINIAWAMDFTIKVIYLPSKSIKHPDLTSKNSENPGDEYLLRTFNQHKFGFTSNIGISRAKFAGNRWVKGP